MNSWCPFALRSWTTAGCGPHVFGPYRGVLHTTEGGTIDGAINTYKVTHNFPHFTIDAHTVQQHVALDQGATALEHPAGTIDTNRASAIQIEIVGCAADAPHFTAPLMGNLARLMRWIESETGIRWEHPPFGIGVGRMNDQLWRSYNGWCGHEHVPHNSHWDPGSLDINSLAPATTKVTPMFSPALTLRPIVAELNCPTGGAWLLGDDGSVYAFGNAPYKGGANGQSYFAGRTPARLELPTDKDAPGSTYVVVATSNERYAY